MEKILIKISIFFLIPSKLWMHVKRIDKSYKGPFQTCSVVIAPAHHQQTLLLVKFLSQSVDMLVCFQNIFDLFYRK